jgi:hypothetical protein
MTFDLTGELLRAPKPARAYKVASGASGDTR